MTPKSNTARSPEDAMPLAPPLEWRNRIKSVVDDWYTETPPRRRYLLRDARRMLGDGYLPRGKAGQLIAEGGAGKTMALVQLAVAIATGQPWFDTFAVERPGRVGLVLGEEDEEEARRRLYNAALGGPTPPPGSIVIVPLCGVPCALLDRDGDGRSIETAFAYDLRRYLVENGPWDLLAFDPLSRFGGPDAETDNATATRFVQVIESIAEATGATALTAHHTNKPSRGGGPVTGSASRGASALVDGFRWQVSLAVEKTDAGEYITLDHTKSNYSRIAEPVVLRRADDGGRLYALDGKAAAEAMDVLSGTAARKGRDAQREEEREAKLSKREEREQAKRAEREREKADKANAKRVSEDRALLGILRQSPGITTDNLRAALAASLGGCNRDRMRDIIARAGDQVEAFTPPEGPGNARAYRLVEVVQ